MGTLLSSRRLLPATILAIVAVIGVRSVALVGSMPGVTGMLPPSGRALLLAGTAAVVNLLPQAHAAAPAPSSLPAPDAPPAKDPRTAQDARPASAETPLPGIAPRAQPITSAPVPMVAAPAPPPEPVVARRSEIEDRERAVAQREMALAVADKRINDRVAELMALQSRLEALQAALKQRDQANWDGLVKLYEGMHPPEAAAIFNALDKPVLLEILDRMKPAKASVVMALMEPEKARQLTADLAARRTASVTAAN